MIKTRENEGRKGRVTLDFEAEEEEEEVEEEEEEEDGRHAVV